MAAPGDSITLPFIMHAAGGGIEGYCFSIDFDEELLTATEIEEAWEIPGGFEYEFARYEINNDNENPGSAGVDEGFLVGAVVFNLGVRVAMPADEDVVAQRLHFDISPDAPDTSTEIRFQDGGRGTAELRYSVRNVVTSAGGEVDIWFAESLVLVDGALVDDFTFIRGDANSDQQINLTDGIYTLNWLFAGAAAPGCLAALNTNGDDDVNLADPVALLNFLFGGGSDPVQPFPDCGPGMLPADTALGCANPSNCQ